MTSKISIGTVSEGTLRNEDLIPALWDILDTYAPVEANKLGAEWDFNQSEEDDFDYDSEEAGWLRESLFDALNEIAPAFCYFGTTDGDGACFGFWPSVEAAREFEDCIEVSDLSQVPTGFNGYVLEVNDHGDATLYSANNGELSEEWSIV